MKIRTGFVSNSSTCSFVVMGYKIPKEDNIGEKVLHNMSSFNKFEKKYKEECGSDTDMDELYAEFADITDIRVLDDEELGYSSDTHIIIGEEIGHQYDEPMDENIVNMSNLTDILCEVKVALNKLNIDNDFVIITGSRMC